MAGSRGETVQGVAGSAPIEAAKPEAVATFGLVPSAPETAASGHPFKETS